MNADNIHSSFTVMTYNVNYGLAGDPAPIINAIRQGNADVVFLQETNERWEKVLSLALKKRFPFIAFQHPVTRSAAGLGVLSRLPIVVREISTSPVEGFPACRVIVQVNKYEKVQVLNVHLYPQDGSSLIRFISGLATSPRLRRREISHHLQVIEPQLPLFVVGDFNEQDCGCAIRLLVKRYAVRSALRLFLGQRSGVKKTTWRWPVGPFTLRQRLDHVFFDTRAFRCVTARVIDAGTSDHLPVVARFRRRLGPSAF